jgi:hypothetical protein
MVLERRLKNGCDFGSGGGTSGIGVRLLSEIALGNGNTRARRALAQIVVPSLPSNLGGEPRALAFAEFDAPAECWRMLFEVK